MIDELPEKFVELVQKILLMNENIIYQNQKIVDLNERIVKGILIIDQDNNDLSVPLLDEDYEDPDDEI